MIVILPSESWPTVGSSSLGSVLSQASFSPLLFSTILLVFFPILLFIQLSFYLFDILYINLTKPTYKVDAGAHTQQPDPTRYRPTGHLGHISQCTTTSLLQQLQGHLGIPDLSPSARSGRSRVPPPLPLYRPSSLLLLAYFRPHAADD